MANKENEKAKRTYSGTSLATTRTVIIFQGTDDFIVGVGDRERARQRASRRHGAYVPSLLYESFCRTLESRSDLSVLLGSLVCGVGSRRGCGEQEDLCELYMYVQDTGYEHNRGSQKELQ